MTTFRGRRGHARVVVFTIIGSELAAAKAAFGATKEVGVDGVFTHPSCAANADKQYPFIIAQSPDRSNTPAAGGVQKLLERYRPEFVVVSGIGGGIQRPNASGEQMEGPAIGDVVVGKYVHYAPYVKSLPTGRSLRYISLDQPASHLVAQHAQILAASDAEDCFAALTLERPDREATYPKVHIGEVIAIESIASNPAAEDQIAMLQQFDNADAVDMESMGVGRALHEFRDSPLYSPTWIAVRGISDIVTAENPPLSPAGEAGEKVSGVLDEDEDNNAQRKLWKGYASAAAAAFAKSLVTRLLADERPASASDPGAAAWQFDGVSA